MCVEKTIKEYHHQKTKKSLLHQHAVLLLVCVH